MFRFGIKGPDKRHQILSILCIAFLCSWGCASRKFVISSNPEGAYVVGYGETTVEKPINKTLLFMGKSDNYQLIAMKRGYHPDTLTILKDSPLAVQFDLKPIDGIPPLIRRPVELSLQNTNLLPVDVEMVLHKGVGALDKYVESEEMSLKAYSDLNGELRNIQSDSTIALLSIVDTSEWQSVSADLETYLKSLSPDLLAYYPEPPSVAHIIKRNSALMAPVLDLLSQTGKEEYLIYGWCKSVKPTTGRIIGNVGVAVGSAVVSGYETAVYGYSTSYYDPSAFAMDNSTLFVAYIIDPGSGEVLGTRQYVVPYDIAKTERLETLARSIMLFPLAENTPEQ